MGRSATHPGGLLPRASLGAHQDIGGRVDYVTSSPHFNPRFSADSRARVAPMISDTILSVLDFCTSSPFLDVPMPWTFHLDTPKRHRAHPPSAFQFGQKRNVGDSFRGPY